LTLDEKASPEMVVYALLVAIRDDVRAGEDVAAREKAVDRQFHLSAPEQIAKQDPRIGLPAHERVEGVVWSWAPTLGYYAGDFPETWESAQGRMAIRPSGGGGAGSEGAGPDARVVKIQLSDPSGADGASVVAQFRLVQEKGFWRVVQVGFDKTRRALKVGGQA
jgi:hypothetical protein